MSLQDMCPKWTASFFLKGFELLLVMSVRSIRILIKPTITFLPVEGLFLPSFRFSIVKWINISKLKLFIISRSQNAIWCPYCWWCLFFYYDIIMILDYLLRILPRLVFSWKWRIAMIILNFCNCDKILNCAVNLVLRENCAWNADEFSK